MALERGYDMITDCCIVRLKDRIRVSNADVPINLSIGILKMQTILFKNELRQAIFRLERSTLTGTVDKS